MSPTIISLPGEILEIGAFWSIRTRDVPSFDRYFSQLQTFYNDFRRVLPHPSSRTRVRTLSFVYIAPSSLLPSESSPSVGSTSSVCSSRTALPTSTRHWNHFRSPRMSSSRIRSSDIPSILSGGSWKAVTAKSGTQGKKLRRRSTSSLWIA